MDVDFVIGFVRAPHGLLGKVKVESTSGEFEHFFKLTDVALKKGEKSVQADVESVEAGTPCLFVKFRGIDSPEAARGFSSWQIVVPRSMACPLRPGEFYVQDLKGCTLLYYGVVPLKGEKVSGVELPEKGKPVTIAVVTDVFEGGAGNLLEVEVSESLDVLCTCTDKTKLPPKNGRRVLIPFKKEFIGTVDIKNRTIQLMHLWILE